MSELETAEQMIAAASSLPFIGGKTHISFALALWEKSRKHGECVHG